MLCCTKVASRLIFSEGSSVPDTSDRFGSMFRGCPQNFPKKSKQSKSRLERQPIARSAFAVQIGSLQYPLVPTSNDDPRSVGVVWRHGCASMSHSSNWAVTPKPVVL